MPPSLQLYVSESGPLQRFWSVLRSAWVATYEDNGFGVAKGAAYSALLAFFPVLTTLATLLVQANAEAVARTIARLLYDVIPPGTEEIVQALFNVHGQRPSWLLVVAVLLSVWAGSGVMMSLMEGFRSIYRIPSGRSFLHERGVVPPRTQVLVHRVRTVSRPAMLRSDQLLECAPVRHPLDAELAVHEIRP